MIFVVALASLTYAVLALVGFLRLRARPRPASSSSPAPISVLKPLCGADDELEGCLLSYFQQDHPEFELLFGVERADDPAVPVVRALIARHPHVPARVVVHGAPLATNPKVSNLLGLWPYTRHERVLISDANTRAPPTLLRSLAATMTDDVGLVSSPIAGTGEATLGAALECATLCGFVAAGVVVPALGQDPVVVGKSMMLRKSALERLGGLASVADVLAEDYLLGKVLQHGGWRVVLDPTVVENVCRTTTLRAYAARQLRWSMLRMRLHPVAFALEPLSSPLAVLPAGVVVGWGAAGRAGLRRGGAAARRRGLVAPARAVGVVDTAGDLTAARAGHAGAVGCHAMAQAGLVARALGAAGHGDPRVRGGSGAPHRSSTCTGAEGLLRRPPHGQEEDGSRGRGQPGTADDRRPARAAGLLPQAGLAVRWRGHGRHAGAVRAWLPGGPLLRAVGVDAPHRQDR
jgi:ceramide glucosyltransferase